MKRVRLNVKQSVGYEHRAKQSSSSSQPKDLTDAPARVRLNMRRSTLETLDERSKQRRVTESLGGDEVMIREVQANEESGSGWPEVSPQYF